MRKRLLKRLGGKRRGFTLIELLIVLSILAVLAAVVVLALTGFIGRGETQACETDHRSLQSAVLAFYTEGTNWPCATQPTSGVPQPIDFTATDESLNAFEPYYVLEEPDTNADCTWSVNSSGIVGATTDAATCPCWGDVPNSDDAGWVTP